MHAFKQDLTEFLQHLTTPEHQFADTLSFIKTWFEVKPSAFKNGRIHSDADHNQGSCQILALAQLLGLTTEQTLLCFGEHYRHVQATPNGDTHLNLREIIHQPDRTVEFEHFPLQRKDTH
ncbi:MAG: HopJ type III effector protein [Venatoribacter sp.]